MRKFRRVTSVRAAPLAVILFLTFAETLSAQAPALEDWASPARALAKKIAEKLKPGQVVALSLQNLSSVSPGRVSQIRANIEAGLAAQGLQLKSSAGKTATSGEETVVEIRITLSESAQRFLWVAEIGKGEGRELVMQSLPRADAEAAGTIAPTMLLQSQALLSQQTPILDFALLGISPPATDRLLVLEPDRVALYALAQGDWKLEQTAAILPSHPAQRDLRGGIVLWEPLQEVMSGNLPANKNTFWAVLPGEVCAGVWKTLALKCEYSSRRPWDEQGPVFWPNSFPGMHPDAAEYSVARIQTKRKWMEVAAGKDGVARLYQDETTGPSFGRDEKKGSLATFTGWGSDLAALKTGCGSGWQILVTRAGDYTERDVVQAIEIIDKQATLATAPLEMPGPVISLRASAAQDAAFAVVRNLQTGQYEAYAFSISCVH